MTKTNKEAAIELLAGLQNETYYSSRDIQKFLLVGAGCSGPDEPASWWVQSRSVLRVVYKGKPDLDGTVVSTRSRGSEIALFLVRRTQIEAGPLEALAGVGQDSTGGALVVDILRELGWRVYSGSRMTTNDLSHFAHLDLRILKRNQTEDLNWSEVEMNYYIAMGQQARAEANLRENKEYLDSCRSTLDEHFRAREGLQQTLTEARVNLAVLRERLERS